MSLTTGTRLGAYEIVALVGSGGMGDVYRAHDPRLGRDVAIKVLPAAFSVDPDRLRRFEQEARAAAALNHPNILTVHDIDTAGGSPFVVSELLEGQTLRTAIESAPGGLALRKAVDYAMQMVSGLAAAHERGIVHRDLKPENVFITRDDRVKILDFGLAKLREETAALAGAGASVLATQALDTAAGVVLGTVGYMSPEQVRGQPVDHRSDIFSFGAVLYEMATGVRAFRGATGADTISAILHADPLEPSPDRPSLPMPVDRIVRHCLEKTRELRFQAARDIGFNLETLSTGASTAAMPAPIMAERRRRLPYVVIGAAALAVVAATAGWRIAATPASAPTFRQVTFRHGAIASARFTPDGRSIVYAAAWEGAPPEIFTVPADQSGGRPLEIKNAVLLSISRTGELAVALEPGAVSPLMRPGTLARGNIAAGVPKAEIENIVDADYAPDGSLALVRYVPDKRICQLEFPIGHALFSDAWLSDVRVSPDGRHVAFVDHANSGDDRGTAMILRTDGAKVAVGPLRDSQRGLAWSPKGDEIWLTSPFADGVIRALDLKGRSRDLLNIPGKLFLRDIAPDGRLLVDDGSTLRGMMVGSTADGTERDVSWLDYSYLRGISDDGRTVVFDEEGNATGRGYRTFVRATDGAPAIDVGPGYGLALSHDKKWTLSLRLADPERELWLQPVGAGEPRRLSPPNLRPGAQARFFPDDKHVVYPAVAAAEPGKGFRIYVQALDGSAPRAVSENGILGAPVSPDAKWIAAGSARGPMLVPVDGGATIAATGIAQGDAPLGWTSDGQWYVAKASGGVTRIDVVNPLTGARKNWRELHPPRMVGVRPALPIVTPDGRFYAYGYGLGFADLFVVSGVR